MSFILDKQTQSDLNLFSSRGKLAIFTLFNHTKTKGGAIQLEEIFRYPLNDRVSINERLETIDFFKKSMVNFPFTIDVIDIIEQYLSNTDTRTVLSLEDNTLGKTFKSLIGAETEKQLIVKGIKAILNLFLQVQEFLKEIGTTVHLTPFSQAYNEMNNLIEMNRYDGKLSYSDLVLLDKQFRFSQRESINKLLFHIYSIDVFIAVAKVATERKFTFPIAVEQEDQKIILTGVYHPLVENAVPNNLLVDQNSNVIFLTGANMAGKSTFMKSFGIAIFLAHIGFPVPAIKMEFTVLDGLYSTINLPDNLNSGYSHFYAEVIRVKQIAEQLKLGKKLLIIFDELFRGTNVKDAYDATVAITGSLAGKSNCIFLVSTHIMEAGSHLSESFQNINFVFLPTNIQEGKPVYTYKLENGISDDRHGMIIIENEGILEILKSRNNKVVK